MVREDLIDGDAFEALAKRLGITYYETHSVDRAGLAGVVLTHNSDGCIVRPDHLPIREYDFVWRDIPAGVKHWFAQNVDVVDERLTPLPIGLERVRWYPEVKKHDIILNTPRGEKTGLCYLNANTRIVVQREVLYQQFGGLDWVTAERGHNGLDFPHYCRQLAAHKFVMCPDGNGMDTHRTWETLYLGSYPIVQRHVFSEFFAQHLPIVIIDDWSEVTEDNLNYVYDVFTGLKERWDADWHWELLTISFWEGLIRSRL